MAKTQPIQAAIDQLLPLQQVVFWEDLIERIMGLRSELTVVRQVQDHDRLELHESIARLLWTANRRRRDAAWLLLRRGPDLVRQSCGPSWDDELTSCFENNEERRSRAKSATVNSLFIASCFPVDATAAERRFRTRLCETIRWCEPLATLNNLRSCLRSEEFKSTLKLEPDSIDIWVDRLQVEQLVAARANKLSKLQTQQALVGESAFSGRLLAHLMDYSNHNGLSDDESKGFFDTNDTPPWDTWIDVVSCDSLYDDILVSWVPQDFVHFVDRGVEAECMGMLSWCDAPRKDKNGNDDFEIPDWLQGVARELRGARA